MEMSYVVLCISLIFIFSANAQSVERKPCKTPDNLNSECIALKECEPLHTLFRGDLTDKQRTFVEQSLCDKEGGKPFEQFEVCCPPPFSENDLPTPDKCSQNYYDEEAFPIEASIAEFPWLALIQYKNVLRNSVGYYCGGSLIHENYVLTAADCVKGKHVVSNEINVDHVRLGEYDLVTRFDCFGGHCADPVIDIQVTEAIVHEKYSNETAIPINNIALLRLARSAPYTEFIRPICLPITPYLKNKSYSREVLEVAGFGLPEFDAEYDYWLHSLLISIPKFKSKLQETDLHECRSLHNSSNINIPNSGGYLCAGRKEDVDIRVLDPGTSLMHMSSNLDRNFWVLVAIQSLRPIEGHGKTVLYEKVGPHIPWILSHMNRNW